VTDTYWAGLTGHGYGLESFLGLRVRFGVHSSEIREHTRASQYPVRRYTTTVPNVLGGFEALVEPFVSFLIGVSMMDMGLDLESSTSNDSGGVVGSATCFDGKDMRLAGATIVAAAPPSERLRRRMNRLPTAVALAAVAPSAADNAA
jgi:hypothetical protein